MSIATRFVFSGPFIVMASIAWGGELPASKQTKAGLYVSAQEAVDMLQDDHVLLVDIRTRAEVAFVGLPERADKHIPYMTMPMMAEFDAAKGTYALEINPDFPADFEAFLASRGVGKDTKVILMCRSGNRSASAANLLAEMGYSNVYSMIDGFEGDKTKEGLHAGHREVNGWRNAGLGWSYKIREDQAYDADF